MIAQVGCVLIAVLIAFPLLLVALLYAAANDPTMFPEFSRGEQRHREDAFFERHGLPPLGRSEYRSGTPNAGAIRTPYLFVGAAHAEPLYCGRCLRDGTLHDGGCVLDTPDPLLADPLSAGGAS